MYKKCALLLFLANCIFWTAGTGCILVKMNLCGAELNPAAGQVIEAYAAYEGQTSPPEEENAVYEKTTGQVKEVIATYMNLFQVEQAETESGQRVVNYDVLVKQPEWKLSDEDYSVLCKIVEAEAGVEDEEGKLLVANVVLNRVENESFPDSVKEVVYQRSGGVSQFSPVGNGRIEHVSVSEETLRAVERAVDGEDISGGALYFIAEKAADPAKRSWFESHLSRLFVHGNHTFYS